VYIAGIAEEFPSGSGCPLPIAFIPGYVTLKVTVASIGLLMISE
jgi:hypothetical protein